MSSESLTLSRPPYDLLLFSCSLLPPLLVPVLFCVITRRRSSPEVILLGSRRIPSFPLGMALCMDFFNVNLLLSSSLIFLLVPTISNITKLVMASFGLTAPFVSSSVFYSLKLTSIQEYLELRYHSRFLRKGVSLIGIISSQMLLPLILYRSASLVSSLSGLPSSPLILASFLILLLLNTCAGLLSSVWCTVWYCLLFLAGIIMVIVFGWKDVDSVFDRWEWDSETSIPHQLGVGIGHLILWASICCSHPSSTLRHSAGTSLSQSRLAMLISVLFSLLLNIGVILASIAVQPSLQQFNSQVLSSTPGMTGLLTCSVVAVILPSLSSLTHSVAASLWDDFLSNLSYFQAVSSTTQVLTIRICMISSSIVTFLLSQYFSDWEKTSRIASLTPSIFSGPLLALCGMGLFIPFTNITGTSIGLVVGIVVTSWIAVGSVISDSFRQINQHFNSTITFNSNLTFQIEEMESPLDLLYSVPTELFPLVGLVITIFTGVGFSVLTNLFHSSPTPPQVLLHPWVRRTTIPITDSPGHQVWDSQRTHYHWPSPSLPPTLKKPRPNVETLGRKGGLAETLSRRKKEESWRTGGGGYDNDSFDKWDESGGWGGTWNSEMSGRK